MINTKTTEIFTLVTFRQHLLPFQFKEINSCCRIVTSSGKYFGSFSINR